MYIFLILSVVSTEIQERKMEHRKFFFRVNLFYCDSTLNAKNNVIKYEEKCERRILRKKRRSEEFFTFFFDERN